MQKRPLSYTLTTPISSLPSPLLSSGACHHPSPVSPHSVTDHSLYSSHNASPPLVRSTDVSAQPYAHPLPSQSKSGPLFWLAHTASPGTQFTKHAQPHTHTFICRHTQGLFSAGTQGKSCHSDNRPKLFQPHPSESPAPLPYGDKEELRFFKIKIISFQIRNECAFPSYSWHSQRRCEDVTETRASVGTMEWCTHNHFTHSLWASVVGLKALHDHLNTNIRGKSENQHCQLNGKHCTAFTKICKWCLAHIEYTIHGINYVISVLVQHANVRLNLIMYMSVWVV